MLKMLIIFTKLEQGHLMKMQKKVGQLPLGQQTSLALGLGRVIA